LTPAQAAQTLLEAAREQNWASSEAENARSWWFDAEPESLAQALATPADRLAAFLNLYNAWAQHLAAEIPRNRIPLSLFMQRGVLLAGKTVSLNTLEHSLIRAGQIWWALGWLKEPFPGRWKKRLRLNKLDCRIHFALNCAAASCPPIRYYQAAKLEEQLDLATQAYLQATLSWDADKRILTLPGIFRFYPGDFGGKRGQLRLLENYGLMPDKPIRKLCYAAWDWSAKLGAYA